MSEASNTPSVPYIDITQATLKNGEWYAFDFAGRKFYATVYNNGFTGYLELTEIPDPYICVACGKSYGDGNHFFAVGRDTHEYQARGAP